MKVTLIIDSSGSMEDIKKDSQKGINQILKDHKDKEFNIIEFGTYTDIKDRDWNINRKGEQPDYGITILHEGVKGSKIGKYNLHPQGGTPLYDAIGAGLSMLDLDEKNFVAIVTDGEENQSNSWEKKHIKPLIEALTKAGVEFKFIGVGVDAYEASAGLGIAHHMAANFSFRDADMAMYSISESIKDIEVDDEKL